MISDPTPPDVDVPALVSAIRKAGRLTQEQLAQRVGVTFGTVNSWENGKHAPIPALLRVLLELASELHVAPVRKDSGRHGASAKKGTRGGGK